MKEEALCPALCPNLVMTLSKLNGIQLGRMTVRMDMSGYPDMTLARKVISFVIKYRSTKVTIYPIILALTKYKLPDEPPCFHQTRDNPNNCFMKTLAKRSGCNVPGLKDKFPMLGNCTETSQTNVYSGLAQDFVIQSEAKTMKTMNEKHCKIPCTMNYYDLTKLDDRLTKCHNEGTNSCLLI